ncbi:HCP-like protein [Gigaspora margarita]|uniref:HCP-like protein n=1 Tax=Gigaspora margarita TaxID=4874 RepID=A0A8H3WXR6_GIGMA|nr:HCP-like protein [Gigaspora margarita]
MMQDEIEMQDSIETDGIETEDEMKTQNSIETEDEMESIIESDIDDVDSISSDSSINEDELYEVENMDDYRERNKNNDNGYSDKKDLTVDASMNIKQVSSTNRGVSYFDNSTSALLFCWLEKYITSTSAYDDLVDILQNPAFNINDVINQKTSSTSKETQLCYYLSIIDIIWNILNNPILYDTLYFGPGVEVKSKKEYWHGDLWAESPLFGQDKIIINRGIILYVPSSYINMFYLNTVEPSKTDVYSMARLTTQKLQLWPVDQYLEEGSIIKLRDVNLDYMHPCEYSTLIAPPPEYNNLKVLKLFIDIYYDDFGTYRNVYQSLGGMYIQLGNMPFDIRKHLRNHFVLGFVPFGGSFNDFIHPFVSDMNQLEKGVLLNIQGNDYCIIAGLRCVTADLPQGNDLAGVKRHGAIRGCRTCLVAKDNATNKNLDIAMISRYHHITNVQFEGISIASTFAQQDEISKKYSLRNSPPILDQLQRERHLQSPQDTYHLIAGITLKLLKLTISMLSLYGEQKFLKSWKSFEYSSQWSKLPNPISHIDSFMISDCLQLGMLFADFAGFPNLHASYHLPRHARTFGTLMNTEVGTKKMVHLDGGIDPRNLQPSIDFIKISQNSKRLFMNWFIQDSFEDYNEEFEISSQSNYIQNIRLRKPVAAHKIMIRTDTSTFRSDLALAYQSFGFNASLIYESYKFYKYASYIQNEDYAEIKCHLNRNNVATI